MTGKSQQNGARTMISDVASPTDGPRQPAEKTDEAEETTDGEETIDEDIANALQPPDGGWGWVIVFAGFMGGVVVDGIIFSFGIVFAEILRTFEAGKSKTSWVGSVMAGTYLTIGPVVSALANRYGCRTVAIVGSIIASIGLLLSVFATSVNYLIFTYGVLGGIGFGLIYLPCIVMVQFYFDKRRAFATGISVCGSGMGGFIFAPLSSMLISQYGWRGNMLIQSAIVTHMLAFGGLLRPFMESRKKRTGVARAVPEGEEELQGKKPLLMSSDRDSSDGHSFHKSHSSQSFKKMYYDDDCTNEDDYPERRSSVDQLTAKLGAAPPYSPKDLRDPNRNGLLMTETPLIEQQQQLYRLTKSSMGLNPPLTIEEAEEEELVKLEGGNGDKKESQDEDQKGESEEKEEGDEELLAPRVTPSSRSSEQTLVARTPQMSLSHDELSARDAHLQALDRHRLEAGTGGCSPRRVSMAAFRTQTPVQLTAINWRRQSLPVNICDEVKRPFYRQDIFYSGSLLRIPQFSSNPSLQRYHCSVVSIPKEMPAIQGKQKPSFVSNCFKSFVCPKTMRDTISNMLDFSLLASPTFLVLCTASFITMMGFFVPFVYLADFANKEGISKEDAAFMFSVIGVANTLGRIFSGWVSDRPNVNALLITNVALTTGGLATCLLPFLHRYELLLVYSGVFGLAIACFASLRSIILVELLGLQKLTNAFGLLLLFQGVASMIGSPMAGFFYDISKSYDTSFYIAGSFIAVSGIMGFPLPVISRWEKRKSKELSMTP